MPSTKACHYLLASAVASQPHSQRHPRQEGGAKGCLWSRKHTAGSSCICVCVCVCVCACVCAAGVRDGRGRGRAPEPPCLPPSPGLHHTWLGGSLLLTRLLSLPGWSLCRCANLGMHNTCFGPCVLATWCAWANPSCLLPGSFCVRLALCGVALHHLRHCRTGGAQDVPRPVPCGSPGRICSACLAC